MRVDQWKIVQATEEYIRRNSLANMVGRTGSEIFPMPLLSLLLAYEEEMRMLREAAGETDPIWHYRVPHRFVALCGTEAGTHGIHWVTTRERVTCVACLKALK